MEAPFSVVDAVSTNENERILKFVGPLALSTMFDFRDTVRAVTTAKLLILDFTGAPYFDSAGMAPSSMPTCRVPMPAGNSPLWAWWSASEPC